MSLKIMDNRLESVEKDDEVKKLQALIIQLEIQNEELRLERQAYLNKGTVVGGGLGQNVISKIPKKESNDLESLNPVEPESSITSDDETWLLDSPSSNSPSKEWLRKDMDDPSLLTVKKSLVNKLNTLSRSQSGSPYRSFANHSPSLVSPESPPSKEIDSRTFVRLKKKKIGNSDFSSYDCRNSPQKKGSSSFKEYRAHSSGSFGSEDDDHLSSASDGSYSSYRLADVEDINIVARLQEESLKMPDLRCTPRYAGIQGRSCGYAKGTNLVTPPVSGESASSQEDLLSSNTLISSPRRLPKLSSGLRPPRKYPCSPGKRTSREGSDVSSPPDSPYNSESCLNTCNGLNVKASPMSRRFGGSDSRLLDQIASEGGSSSCTGGSSSDLQCDIKVASSRVSHLQTPLLKVRPSSYGNSPVRVPNISDIPRQSASSIPRPGSRPQSAKSLRATTVSLRPSSGSSDWREGCY